MVVLDGNQLLIDGRHVPLLSGEFHFWRVDPAFWERCLRQIKDMGLPIVATYLSWRRHNPTPGRFDFEGETDPRLNLGRFLELCAEVGLWVHIKPGPWICAEEINGGYPEWLISQPDLQVLDSQNQVVRGYMPPFDSPIPSYLHPTYLEHVRAWIRAVDDRIRPYVHPHGAIILIQVDNEPCWTFHDALLESDYSPVMLDHYRQWLRQKYESLDRLNAAHHADYLDYSQVDAPRPNNMNVEPDVPPCRLVDWVQFKEWTLTQHISRIRGMHEENGVHDAIFTVNYNLHDPLAVPANWHQLDSITGLSGFDYYPFPTLDFGNFADMALNCAYSLAVCKVPWSPEIMSGVWRFPNVEPPPITQQHIEYLYLLTLAFGLKGMNFYMLVNRENWQEAPLDEQGDPTPAYWLPQQVVKLMGAIPGFASLHKVQQVGLVYYRPHARDAYMAANKDDQRGSLDYDSFRALYRSLLRVNCDPGIIDRWVNGEQMHLYRLVFAPAMRDLDNDTARLLREYVERGGSVVTNPLEGLEGTSLRELLAAHHAAGPIQAGTPGIMTILHENDDIQVLFVLNTEAGLLRTELSFEQEMSGALYEILTGNHIAILDGKTALQLNPRSVRIFLIQEYL